MIDLRSDTITLPTPEMLESMTRAKLGDDMRERDPTVCELEDLAAEKTGTEAALFVTSGTMGNLVALLNSHRPGRGSAYRPFGASRPERSRQYCANCGALSPSL